MNVFDRVCLAVWILFFSGNVLAAEVGFGGQVRPRFEFREPVAQGYDSFTSMRVRAQVKASLERDVGVLIQVQDVRLWGEEANTLGDFRADNFDLHQGFVELKKIWDTPWSMRLGRQEVSFGGQRLIGAVGWTQQGRAFDGMRLTLRREAGILEGSSLFHVGSFISSLPAMR